jgi:hypothetical protein
VFVEQRGVVGRDADAEDAETRILVHEMMVRLTDREYGTRNRLRVQRDGTD